MIRIGSVGLSMPAPGLYKPFFMVKSEPRSRSAASGPIQ